MNQSVGANMQGFSGKQWNKHIEYTFGKDKETGKTKKYKSREIEEGYKNLKISPFDGCGCHEHGFMENVSAQLGLDYNVIGTQVRLPFVKGYSVYVPFRQILKEWGHEYITDIYGVKHPISTVDCISLQIFMVQNILLVRLIVFGIFLCLKVTRFSKKSMAIMLGLNI